MSDENIRVGSCRHMRSYDLGLYLNAILLLHEEVDATSQSNGIDKFSRSDSIMKRQILSTFKSFCRDD